MKKDLIIFGAGQYGRFAISQYEESRNIVFIIDNDSSKWGGSILGHEICSPQKAKDYPETEICIAVKFVGGIEYQLQKLGCKNIFCFEYERENFLTDSIREIIESRMVDLGSFLGASKNPIYLKEMPFQTGGSGIPDYMFLRRVAETIGAKNYLEIGTYIGASINIMTDICERLYSITLPPSDSMFDRLAYDEKITHFYGDSKQFDFSNITDQIDMYYIDGDHSYEGVLADTRNIFNSKSDDAVVVWHDCFYAKERRPYRADTIYAIYDAIGKEKFKNFYVTDSLSLCGIYLPDKYKDQFPATTLKEQKDRDLMYTFDLYMNRVGER